MVNPKVTRLSRDEAGGIAANPISASYSSFLFSKDLIDATPKVPSTGENDFPLPSRLWRSKRGVVSVVIITSSCEDSLPSFPKRKPPKKTLHLEGACCLRNSA